MKKFIGIFIKRPVLSSAISLSVFLFGLFSLQHMSLRLFPKIISPVISVNTNYFGASSELMSSYITSVIQNALAGIEGLNYIKSSSSPSTSEIVLYMKIGSDPQSVICSVLSKISSVEAQLPQEIEKPSVTVSSSDSDPVMILAATSKELERKEVADYIRRSVKPRLEGIDGISEVQVIGRSEAMRLWLNPIKMAGRGITAQDVSHAIQSNNMLSAAGKTLAKDTYFNIHATTDIHTTKGFNSIVIKSHNGAYVKLQDIGEAQLGDKNDDVSSFYNGKPSTLIFIKLLPGANPVEITDYIKTLLPNINAVLPFDIKLNDVVDNGYFIHESIHEVIRTLFLTIVIVILVVYVFLGSIRAMVIPVIAIPLSLLGVFIFLWVQNYSINTLTLLGLVVAVGLVVDDAIVVVENICRYIEAGMSAFSAAIIGTQEMFYPIIGMSITLAAVYLPIGLSSGLTGQLFKEFVFTLSGAVILSGFIALTLVPMLCSRILTENRCKNAFVNKVEQYQKLFVFIYKKILYWSLQNYKILLTIWFLIILSTFGLFFTIPKELAPEEDQGLLITFSSAPNYTNRDFVNTYAQQLMKIFSKNLSSDSQVVVAGIPDIHHIMSFVSLNDWGKRNSTATQLKVHLQKEVNQVPGIQTIVINPTSIPGDSDLPLQIVLKSTESYEKLFKITQYIIGMAWESGLFEFIQSDLKYDQPAIKMDINRDSAATLGISMFQIANTLSLVLGGNQIQHYTRDNQNYFVIPQVNPIFRKNPNDLNNIHISTASGKLVPLSSVAKSSIFIEPEHLNQFQKMNAITISGQMKSGYSLSDAVKFFERAVQAFDPNEVMLDYAGQTRQYIQEGSRMLGIFIAAFSVIFLVLAIQFECYKSPLVILLGTVPFALFAACLSLLLGRNTLNIYTQIGLLTLIGLISKHGILITEFANKLQCKGVSKAESIIKACLMRFRPILMTTAAMVLGVLPLVLATGAGSSSRNKLGVVIATGMLIGTTLSLVILPVLYFVLAPSFNENKK